MTVSGIARVAVLSGRSCRGRDLPHLFVDFPPPKLGRARLVAPCVLGGAHSLWIWLAVTFTTMLGDDRADRRFRRDCCGSLPSSRERVLLALTIVGFVAPNAMVTLFVIDHGLDISGYVNDWGHSLPAAQLAADVSIAFLAFALWAAWEGRRIGMRAWWLPIPASALVGLCFAVPLFLLFRERAVRERTPSPGPSEAIESIVG